MVCAALGSPFLDRKKIARARLVSGPAGEAVLVRVGDDPFHGRAGGLVVRGVDDQPGAGRGLHREAGGGHLQPRVERMPEHLGVVGRLGHVLSGPVVSVPG